MATDTAPTHRDFLGFGWLLLDSLMELDSYPTQNTRTTARVDPIAQTGGPVTRALMTLAKYGAHADMIGAIGADPTGRSVLTELRDLNIDVSRIHMDTANPTRQSHIWHCHDNASRTIVYAPNGPNPGEIKPDLLLHKPYSALLLDGRHHESSLILAQAARQHDIPVAIDMGGGARIATRELLEYSTIIMGTKKSWEELATNPDESAEDVMASYPTKMCIYTVDGHTVEAHHDGIWTSITPGEFTITDSIGGGDVFFGSLVWALIDQSDPAYALAFAANAAKLKCQTIGNQNLPTLPEVIDATQEYLNN